MKITISGNVIEGTPEELAEYFAMTEDLAKADMCEDVCCEDIEPEDNPKLKAGDFVVFSDFDRYADITIGTPYEIYFDGEDLAFKDDVGDERVYPLTNDDCKYEILSADEAKWAKLGRKVGQLKQGDIVFVTHSDGGILYGKATENGTNGSIMVDFGKTLRICTEKISDLTLVAPVESVLTHN